MKFPRRRFLGLTAAVASFPVAAPNASAQAYPVRPVRWLIGFAAGGAPDILARLMTQWLSDRLGQRFLVENQARRKQ